MQTERYLLHVLFVPGDRVASPSISAGNPLLLNSSMQPDLTVGRAYSTPLCFRDGADKDLFDPLPDIKMKVQSSFMVSLGVSERAEFHAKGPAETFPRDLSRDYGGTADRRKKGLLTLNGPFSTCREQLGTSGVFGHPGGRMVVPNAGELHGKVGGVGGGSERCRRLLSRRWRRERSRRSELR